MPKPSHDPSIDQEPHLRPATEEVFAEKMPIEAPLTVDPKAEGVEHTVWDEPTHLANEAAEAAPKGEITYERWVEAGIQRTTWIETWSITLVLVLAAGPWGIVGAIVSSMSAHGIGWGGLLSAVVLAPVTEEITKVAALLWVVEKRPYWFKSLWQILICAVAGGMLFATIENLIYIYVYVPDGNEAFQRWRWTVCTGLHVNCSFLAGIGLIRIWDNAIRNRCRPELALGMPFFAMAMVGHGLYNLTVSLAEMYGWLSFD